MYPKTLNEVPVSIRARVTIERRIVKKTVDTLLAAGYALNVENGGDSYELTAPTTERKRILDVMVEADDDRLYVWRPTDNVNDYPFGWVYFVYGNDGYDVISDYTTNLEDVLKPVNDYAETFDN